MPAYEIYAQTHTHTRTRACCVMYECTKRTWRFPRKHLRYICKIESEKRVGRRWKTYGIRWPSSPSTHSSAIFHSDILTFIAIYSRIRLFVCSSVRSFAPVQSFVRVILAVNTLCSGPKFASSAAFCLFSFANVDRFQSVRRIYIWFSRMDRTQSRHRLHTFNWLLSIIHFFDVIYFGGNEAARKCIIFSRPFIWLLRIHTNSLLPSNVSANTPLIIRFKRNKSVNKHAMH